MCKSLRESFYHVFAVLYLTPPDSQTAPVHNDDQDVFLMQIWGDKQWHLYEAPQPLIFTEEMIGKSGPVTETLVEKAQLTMKPGDLLYLPRGMPHEARTSKGSPSLHITVTMATSDSTNWSVFFQHAEHLVRSKQLQDDLFFRRSIKAPAAMGLPPTENASEQQKRLFE